MYQSEQPAPMSELERIRMRMNAVADESLESTQRMVRMAEQAKEAGISTLVRLDEQGEQLDNIEENMDQINNDMKETEKDLNQLTKCCGLCVLPWKRSYKKSSTNYDVAFKKTDDVKLQGNQRVPPSAQNGGYPAQGGFITRVTNDAREDEMDKNLTDVSEIVGNLRNIAIDIGQEVESQNRQLDRLNDKAQSNEDRIADANRKATRILK